MRGLPKWNDRACYYSQANNSIEGFLGALGLGFKTESCGPTAAVTILSCMGYAVDVVVPGTYKPQPEQVLWDYLNDPRNFPRFAAVRPNLEPGTIPGNQVPQYYPTAIMEVFGKTATFQMGLTFAQVAEKVSSGKGVQICLKRPGHYLPVVAYDEVARELIYHDPLPSRHRGGNGFARRLTEAEFAANVQPYGIFFE